MAGLGNSYAWVAPGRARTGEAGLAEIRQGIADWRATGSGIWLPYYHGLLVETCGKVGRFAEGLQVVDEALAESWVNGEGWYEAELYRLKGTLTLQRQIKGNRQGKSQKSKPSPPAPNT